MGKKRIIIYGAGKMGQAYLLFLRKYNLHSCVQCFCDRNAEEIGMLEALPVVSYQEACKLGLPFVVAVRKALEAEVVRLLMRDGKRFYHSLDNWVVDELHLMPRLRYERELCAISHINSMDQYFEIAESEGVLDFFWGE